MPREKPTAGLVTAIGKAINASKAPWVVLAIIALALILAACALDREALDRRRADLREVCEGAMTTPLRLACARAGLDVGPKLESEE